MTITSANGYLTCMTISIRLQIKLFTILVGPQDLLSIKITMQCAGLFPIALRAPSNEPSRAATVAPFIGSFVMALT